MDDPELVSSAADPADEPPVELPDTDPEGTPPVDEGNDPPPPDDSGEPEPETDAFGQPIEREPEPEPEPEMEPVTVRAGGQVFQVPGAVRAPEGMYVPTEHVDAVLALISRGRHHEMTWPQETQRFKEETRRLQAVNEVDKAEAAAWTAEMTKITASEEAFLAFVDNLTTNLETMKYRVQQARTGKELEMLRQGIRLEAPSTELTGKEFVQAASETLLGHFDQISEDPEMAALLPREDRDVVWQQIAKQANLYITTAPMDIPDEGIVKGERVIDIAKLAGDVRRFADLLGHGRRSATALKPARAEELNKRINGAPTVRAPRPTGRAAGGSPRSGAPTPPTDYAGWRDRLISLASQET